MISILWHDLISIALMDFLFILKSKHHLVLWWLNELLSAFNVSVQSSPVRRSAVQPGMEGRPLIGRCLYVCFQIS